MRKYGVLVAIGVVSGVVTGFGGPVVSYLTLFAGVVFAAAMALYSAYREGFRSGSGICGFVVTGTLAYLVASCAGIWSGPVILLFLRVGGGGLENRTVSAVEIAVAFVGGSVGAMLMVAARYRFLGKKQSLIRLISTTVLVGLILGAAGAAGYALSERGWHHPGTIMPGDPLLPMFVIWQGVMAPLLVWAVPIREAKA
jgi:hypothetical protein